MLRDEPRPGGWIGAIARRVLLNAALGIASLAFAAVVAELAVRVLAPQQLIQIRPDVWQPADTVGWLRRPNVNAVINTGERTVHMYTDAEGFRVGAAGRVTDGRRVLILGDSFMEALQVEYEQSFAGRLQAALPAAAGVPVAVRNAGVAGWQPDHYLLRARTLLLRDDYRLVIVSLYVGNDAVPKRVDYWPPRAPVVRYQLRIPRRVAWAEFVDAILRPINDALEVRSHLFVFVRSRLQTLRMRTGLSPVNFPVELMKSHSAAARWSITGDLCRELKDVAASHGAATVFVLIPAHYQVEEADFGRYLRGFGVDSSAVDVDQATRRLTQELTARGLTVVDALPEFRARHAAGEHLYGTVDEHLSPQGHEALAELVLPVAARILSAGGL